MFNRKFVLFIAIFSLFTAVANPLFAEDTSAEEYNTKEFPQSLKDLRRFEIVTLGALPFITLDVSIVKSVENWYKNGQNTQEGPNIFAVNTYTQEEQIKILKTSLAISVGVGLTDYIVRVGKRVYTKYQNKKENKSVLIMPLEEDPDAIKLENPFEEMQEDEPVQTIEEFEQSESLIDSSDVIDVEEIEDNQ